MANILFIASGFPPYEFSENIINGKLVLALMKKGHSVQVISKIDEGPTYNSEWSEPWLDLKPITHNISYSYGGKIKRLFEAVRNTIYFKYPQYGIRWAGYAYRKAKELIADNNFDVIITRSPTDISHLVGLRLKKNLNIRWIANWNDPSSGTWPEPYEKSVPFWKKFIYKRFAQEVLALADKTTFPSHMLFEHFKEHFNLEESRISIIPHIMLQPCILNEPGSHPKDLKIIHCGNLSAERDPRNLLLAIRKFNDRRDVKVYLDIMGVISKEGSDLILKSGLEKYVRKINPMPYFEAMEKMTHYDVLLILEARLAKGIFLPSKISDYAQINKPILAVSPKDGEVKNLIEKYGGGIAADNNSVHDIFEKISILSDMKTQKRLKENLGENLLQRYLGEDRIIKLFEEYILTLAYSNKA